MRDPFQIYKEKEAKRKEAIRQLFFGKSKEVALLKPPKDAKKKK